jgi:hypothetical protein
MLDKEHVVSRGEWISDCEVNDWLSSVSSCKNGEVFKAVVWMVFYMVNMANYAG